MKPPILINGKAVEALRKARHLTRTQAAAASDISRSHWANIERGIKQPSPEAAVRMAAVLGVDLDAISTYASAGAA